MTPAEYYKALAERHKQTDWDSLPSIWAYNEYARMLRSQMEEEEEKCVEKRQQ